MNLRLSKIEESLYNQSRKTSEVLDDLRAKAEGVVPELRKLKVKAIQSETLYRDLHREALTARSRKDLAENVDRWALFMNDASTRLEVEAKAIELANQSLCLFITEKNAMFENLRLAIEEMRFLHDRLHLPKITESVEVQTDEPDSSIDVS